jgi:hypothetical protein
MAPAYLKLSRLAKIWEKALAKNIYGMAMLASPRIRETASFLEKSGLAMPAKTKGRQNANTRGTHG